jgi:hypothetical protein
MRFKNLLKMDLENQIEKKNFIFPLPNSPSACWPGQPAGPLAFSPGPHALFFPLPPHSLLGRPNRRKATAAAPPSLSQRLTAWAHLSAPFSNLRSLSRSKPQPPSTAPRPRSPLRGSVSPHLGSFKRGARPIYSFRFSSFPLLSLA